MEAWLQVAAIAFVAQLSVLPGEKVQFIIAGLSTRFHPLLVVSAAGTAFAGWTALEIMFGQYLQEALSPFLLDMLTAGLFLLFAVMLYRSAPAADESPAETDGGMLMAGPGELDVRVPVVDWKVPNRLRGFLPIFAMMAFGEFGDKTQLVTIGLAAQYSAGTAIWAGEMAAIIPVSLANAYFFHRFAGRFDVRKAHYAGAAMFAFFGVDTLQAKVTGVSLWERGVEFVGAAVGDVLAVLV
ncbi:TMEM165/GDT1 family protein [Halomicrobium salinisoli]|uniref:TMEM165/GDT1 family protein n=1 Tax=Halomicrobium salinisoli TaxID=2878391 RepID=UPI001CF04A54|nr:TMEM165/GDT1 family protein [Halomicrobium salinisoli]